MWLGKDLADGNPAGGQLLTARETGEVVQLLREGTAIVVEQLIPIAHLVQTVK